MGRSSGYSCANLGVESFSSDFPETGWYNLVCGVLVEDKANSGSFLFYWELMLLSVMGVGFKNTRTVSRKCNISKVVPRLFGWIYKTVIKL